MKFQTFTDYLLNLYMNGNDTKGETDGFQDWLAEKDVRYIISLAGLWRDQEVSQIVTKMDRIMHRPLSNAEKEEMK